MRRSVLLLLAGVFGILLSFSAQQPSAAEPASPGSGYVANPLSTGLRFLKGAAVLRPTAKQVNNAVKRPPPPPPSTFTLQPWIVNYANESVPPDPAGADILYVSVGGQTVMRMVIQQDTTISVPVPIALVNFTGNLTIPSTGTFFSCNVRPSSPVVKVAPRLWIEYLNPPNFTTEGFGILGANQLPAAQIVAQPDGSFTYSWTRLGFLTSPDYIFPGVGLPGARIKKVGIGMASNYGPTGLQTYDLKNVKLLNKPVGFNLNSGVLTGSPFAPWTLLGNTF